MYKILNIRYFYRKPGALHISKKTKDMLMGDYNIVEAPKSDDPTILAYGQPTYHILPSEDNPMGGGLQRVSSIYINKRRAMELRYSIFILHIEKIKQNKDTIPQIVHNL